MASLRLYPNELREVVEMRPLQHEFILVIVQAHAKPNTPDDVEVGANTSH